MLAHKFVRLALYLLTSLADVNFGNNISLKTKLDSGRRLAVPLGFGSNKTSYFNLQCKWYLAKWTSKNSKECAPPIKL